MGKRNQLYCRWIRILPNPDNDKEIYLVLAKDTPMEKKYIRQFENMFQGKDVILTIVELIRSKNKTKELQTEEPVQEEEIEPEPKKQKKDKNEIPEEQKHTALWDVE